MNRKCGICGKPLQPYQKRYCSSQCLGISQRRENYRNRKKKCTIRKVRYVPKISEDEQIAINLQCDRMDNLTFECRIYTETDPEFQELVRLYEER